MSMSAVTARPDDASQALIRSPMRGCDHPLSGYVVVSIIGGPQNRPPNATLLIIGAPQNGTPNFGNPPCGKCGVGKKVIERPPCLSDLRRFCGVLMVPNMFSILLYVLVYHSIISHTIVCYIVVKCSKCNILWHIIPLGLCSAETPSRKRSRTALLVSICSSNCDSNTNSNSNNTNKNTNDTSLSTTEKSATRLRNDRCCPV